MPDYKFKLDFQVRDYECDLQGIVNNAVYQNYLEHTRHEFLKSIGIDFAYFAEKGIHLIAIRAELDYKYPLKSGDRFWVGLNLERASRIRFAFFQDIYRQVDDKLVLKAKIVAAALNERGRPASLPEIESAFNRIAGHHD
jgi:acyl-CoA thioester hydrolase